MTSDGIPTFPISTDSNTIRSLAGMHPRVERDPLHERLFSTGEVTQTAALNFDHLQALAETETTAREYLGQDTDIISLTTIHDEKLYDLPLRKELKVVHETMPRWHVGFDCPVYKDGDMEEERRWTNLEHYAAGINWLDDRVDADRTQLLPFLKGTCAREWRWCFNQVRHICNGVVAYYAGQYFGPEVGFRINQLRQDLWTIDAVCNPAGIFLIGLLSPRYLRTLPGSVFAATGLQHWIDRTLFRELPLDTARLLYRQLDAEVTGALANGHSQTALSQFASSRSDLHG